MTCFSPLLYHFGPPLADIQKEYNQHFLEWQRVPIMKMFWGKSKSNKCWTSIIARGAASLKNWSCEMAHYHCCIQDYPRRPQDYVLPATNLHAGTANAAQVAPNVAQVTPKAVQLAPETAQVAPNATEPNAIVHTAASSAARIATPTTQATAQVPFSIDEMAEHSNRLLNIGTFFCSRSKILKDILTSDHDW